MGISEYLINLSNTPEGIVLSLFIIILITIITVVLPVVLNKLFIKNNNNLSNNINIGLNNFATTLSNNISEQNNVLIKSMQENQNKLLDNQINMISYMMKSDKEIHDVGLSKRQEVLHQIKPILKRLLTGTNSSRVAIIEFHNSKTNIDGLPFLWYDIQAEFFKRGEKSISNIVKDMQAFNLIDVIKTVNSDVNNICWYDKDDLDDLYNESPVLYDYLVNKLNIQSICYIGLYNSENTLFGLLTFEWDYDYKYDTVTDLQKNQVLQVARQLENLLKTVPIKHHN